MASLKNGAHSAFVGATTGAYVLGTAMRLREATVDIVESKLSPEFEHCCNRRQVLSDTTVRNLIDIGFTEKVVMRYLKPAKKWKFVTHQLDLMREGDSYTGCAPGERIFQVSDGMLRRCLRQEYLKFGGNLHWDTKAFRPEELMDDSGHWTLRKEYGPLTKLELIVNYSKPLFNDWKSEIFEPSQRIPFLLFNSSEGFSENPPSELLRHFGSRSDHSYMTVLGREVVMNVWEPKDGTLAWQLISQATPEDDAVGPDGKELGQRTSHSKSKRIQRAVEEFHPSLRTLMGQTNNRKSLTKHDIIKIPLERPTFLFEDKHHATPSSPRWLRKVTSLGDTVCPVDSFNWRGDKASLQIEEAIDLCRRFATNNSKFHRMDSAHELREFEMDSLKHRFDTATLRDLKDAEMFLNVNPELPRDEDEESDQAKIPESKPEDGHVAAPGAAA